MAQPRDTINHLIQHYAPEVLGARAVTFLR